MMAMGALVLSQDRHRTVDAGKFPDFVARLIQRGAAVATVTVSVNP